MNCPFRSRISRLLSRRDEPDAKAQERTARYSLYRPGGKVDVISTGSEFDIYKSRR
jgi:hypothetical protein